MSAPPPPSTPKTDSQGNLLTTHLSTSKAWDSTSINYASIARTKSPIHIPLQSLLALADSISPFASATAILDNGCGPGTATSALLEKYAGVIPSNTRLVAADFSAGMIEQVRVTRDKALQEPANTTSSSSSSSSSSSAETAAAWTRLETAVADAQDLAPFAGSSFSHILASFVLMLVPSPAAALAAAYRTLAPGGVLALSCWESVGWMDMLADAAAVVRPASPTSEKDGKGEGEGRRRKVVMPAEWKSVAGVRGEMEKAGFGKVRVERVETGMKVDRAAVEGMVKGGNPGSEMVVGGYSERELDGVVEEYLRMAEKLEGGVVKGIALVAVGVKEV